MVFNSAVEGIEALAACARETPSRDAVHGHLIRELVKIFVCLKAYILK
jgi:hypothetical protein